MIEYVFGVVVPYVAIVIFIIGVIYRIIEWAKSPVPLKIPTTAGQEFSPLPFIRRTVYDMVDCPQTKLGTVIRMFFEVFLMRSLFRNVRYYYDKNEHVDTRWLWFFAMAFHYSLLVILIRHMRFFTNPVPDIIETIDWVDGMMKYWVPSIYVTGVLALVSLAFLWGRRLFLARERTISLPSDHIPLILFAVILISGTLMRYFIKIDLYDVKTLAIGLFTFQPPSYEVLRGIHWLFYVHLTFVSILIAYIPFSKLMHFVGIFFSPTRNMPNDNRVHIHINPWDPEIKGITWEEYYEMYKDQLDEIAEEGYKVRPEV